jgi:hypothetical protein
VCRIDFRSSNARQPCHAHASHVCAAYVHKHTHTHTHVRRFVNTKSLLHVYVRIFTYIYVNTHTYIYT